MISSKYEKAQRIYLCSRRATDRITTYCTRNLNWRTVKMKWIVFWVVVTFTSLPHTQKPDEFGRSNITFNQTADLRVRALKDTLQREFKTRDSAVAFMERALAGERQKMNLTMTSYVDTAWMVSPVTAIADGVDTKGLTSSRFAILGTDAYIFTAPPVSDRATIYLTNKRKLVISGGVDTVVIEG